MRARDYWNLFQAVAFVVWALEGIHLNHLAARVFLTISLAICGQIGG